MRRLFLILALALSMPACEVIGPALVTTISTLLTELIDASHKVDALDRAAREWFKEYPNEALQADWHSAVDRTRAGIDVGLAAAHGAEELSYADHHSAIEHFVVAWDGLVTLARQIGFLQAGDVLGAGPQRGVALAPPLACSRSLR